ncbi:putative Lysophospholipid acyltransferase LPEAT1 [Blattamonas nauphoetae]|uniref:Lysophospholipid acyltransferase LPEAT1 n=1 Tax=Blattamonas nauphoetae TaxID=2049346 RepID=A0ABQ9WSX7_9EUKA|nr:putative Lysophospholipid acyltransferase LPEAT1 [Blattamonas nauphoetae]
MYANPHPINHERLLQHPQLKFYTLPLPGPKWYRFFKRWIFPGPLIALARVILFIMLFVLMYIFLRLTYLGYSDWDNPPPKWRRALGRFVLRSGAILTCFIFAIIPKVADHTKPKKGQKEDPERPSFNIDEHYTMVANHNSMFDGIIGSSLLGSPSVLTTRALMDAPVLGFVLKQMRAISSTGSRSGTGKTKTTVEALGDRQRSTDPNEYSVLVYPEGTNSNGSCVAKFHKGAFVAGLPVRPVAQIYPYKYHCMSWCSPCFVNVIFETGCQFYNQAEYHILDLYVPSIEEQKNPQLYADNVGKYIANFMGVDYRPDLDVPHNRVQCRVWDRQVTWDEAMQQLDAVNSGLKPSL